MIVTPGPAVVFALATAILIWSGMAVRRLRAGKDTWIDAIGAMRVAVFARTSALVGSSLSGILVGVMGVSLTQLEATAMVSNAIGSGVSALVGVVWVVIAVVIERWCVITPDDRRSHLQQTKRCGLNGCGARLIAAAGLVGLGDGFVDRLWVCG